MFFGKNFYFTQKPLKCFYQFVNNLIFIFVYKKALYANPALSEQQQKSKKKYIYKIIITSRSNFLLYFRHITTFTVSTQMKNGKINFYKWVFKSLSFAALSLASLLTTTTKYIYFMLYFFCVWRIFLEVLCYAQYYQTHAIAGEEVGI